MTKKRQLHQTVAEQSAIETNNNRTKKEDDDNLERIQTSPKRTKKVHPNNNIPIVTVTVTSTALGIGYNDKGNAEEVMEESCSLSSSCPMHHTHATSKITPYETEDKTTSSTNVQQQSIIQDEQTCSIFLQAESLSTNASTTATPTHNENIMQKNTFLNENDTQTFSSINLTHHNNDNHEHHDKTSTSSTINNEMNVISSHLLINNQQQIGKEKESEQQATTTTAHTKSTMPNTPLLEASVRSEEETVVEEVRLKQVDIQKNLIPRRLETEFISTSTCESISSSTSSPPSLPSSSFSSKVFNFLLRYLIVSSLLIILFYMLLRTVIILQSTSSTSISTPTSLLSTSPPTSLSYSKSVSILNHEATPTIQEQSKMPKIIHEHILKKLVIINKHENDDNGNNNNNGNGNNNEDDDDEKKGENMGIIKAVHHFIKSIKLTKDPVEENTISKNVIESMIKHYYGPAYF